MQISVVERRNGEKDGKYGCYVASKFQVSSSAHPYLAGACFPLLALASLKGVALQRALNA
jgi:hypothetical protein